VALGAAARLEEPFTRQDISDITINELAPARAVLITCIIDDAGTFRGAPFETRCHTVHVCVHDGARWLFLFGQSTATQVSTGSQPAHEST
jgi:hypothetical protein